MMDLSAVDIATMWMPAPPVQCQYKCPYQAAAAAAQQKVQAQQQMHCPYQNMPNYVCPYLNENTVDTLLRDITGEGPPLQDSSSGSALQPAEFAPANEGPAAFVKLESILPLGGTSIPSSQQGLNVSVPPADNATPPVADDEECEICYDGEKMEVTASRFAVCGYVSFFLGIVWKCAQGKSLSIVLFASPSQSIFTHLPARLFAAHSVVCVRCTRVAARSST